VPRAALERRWLDLTKHELPARARTEGWPLVFDHCFQRVLLDHATGGCWYDAIPKRPAYRHAPEPVLREAVAEGERLLRDADGGAARLQDLDARSLRARGKPPKR
jgi:hypothetical protein